MHRDKQEDHHPLTQVVLTGRNGGLQHPAADEVDNLNLVVSLQHRALPLSTANNHVVEFYCHSLRLQTQTGDQLKNRDVVFNVPRFAVKLNAQGF